MKCVSFFRCNEFFVQMYKIHPALKISQKIYGNYDKCNLLCLTNMPCLKIEKLYVVED